MKNYKEIFKDKRITVMGLGLLGRGLGYTAFLAECGASLIVTDLKSEAELATSIKALKKYRNIRFVLGEHRLEDFQDRDMVIKAAGVPIDSTYIKEARKNKIPVEMDVSLFAKCMPRVTIIGVTGTRGKSMTTMLIYEILKANEKSLNKNVYLGGNIRGVATMPLLKKAKDGDILVCELDSWQLQGFGEARISPHVSVFTSFMPDHMNYYKNDINKYFSDKANIFKYQKKGDILVIRPQMRKLLPKDIESKVIVANKKNYEDVTFIVPGDHQRENMACAIEVAKQFHIPTSALRKAVKNFRGVEGRLQYVKSINGVKIYNDNNATTPQATCAGIEALGAKNNIILIAGGTDKNLDAKPLAKMVDKYCKAAVLLPGTGTDKLLALKLKHKNIHTIDTLKNAVQIALSESMKGDIILFSPAFASFGMFNNEYERNDQFMKIISKLK